MMKHQQKGQKYNRNKRLPQFEWQMMSSITLFAMQFLQLSLFSLLASKVTETATGGFL